MSKINKTMSAEKFSKVEEKEWLDMTAKGYALKLVSGHCCDILRLIKFCT